MKKKIWIAVVTAIVTVALTQIVQLSVGGWVKSRAKAVLVKDIVNWNPSTVPQAVQSQIKYVPINYTLRHSSGGTATHVSVFVKSSDVPIDPTSFIFTPDSEVHQIGLSDARTLRIDIPEMRPTSVLSFQFSTTNTAHITFSELAADADFVEAKDLAASQGKKSSLGQTLAVTGIVLFWVVGVAAAVYIFWKVGKRWNESETADSTPNRKLVIWFVVGLLIYELVFSSFGPIAGFIPFPRVGFDELTGAFIFYLLVTRYRLLEAWIIAHTKVNQYSMSRPRTESQQSTPPDVQIPPNGGGASASEKTGETFIKGKPPETIVQV